MPGDKKTWGDRGATSYSANWHAFGGGWGEDWQKGGKARIPTSFPDGTSSTIAFLERRTICGNPSKDSGSLYVERIWGEDGQNGGPIGNTYTNNATFLAAYWVQQNSTGDLGQLFNPDSTGKSYPFRAQDLITGTIQNNPSQFDCLPNKLATFGASGLQVLLVDGSVRNVRPSINTLTLHTALVPNDGGVLGSDW